MEWFFYFIFFGAIPAFTSVCYLLPKASWATRIKVVASRRLLKFPFGLIFGFLAILLIEIFRVGVITNAIHWVLLSLSIYLLLAWLYLFLYKLMLNRVFKQAITWSAIINSIMLEVGIIVAFVVTGFGLSLALS